MRYEIIIREKSHLTEIESTIADSFAEALEAVEDQLKAECRNIEFIEYTIRRLRDE